MTGAGHLKARQVIHAVGPRMGEGDEDRKLASAVRASLALADRRGLKSIAIPAISTGVFGFPLPLAAEITVAAAKSFAPHAEYVQKIVFCLLDDDVYDAFHKALGT